MRMSRKSEYACLALLMLAGRYGGGPVKMVEIAEGQGIPKKYLEQILLQLKSAGYVRSTSGVGGGYALAKLPEQITLAEVIRLIDGPLAPVRSASKYYYESTPIERNEKLLGVFKQIREYVSDTLEGTTLRDLL